jgi:hypothetical protein
VSAAADDRAATVDTLDWVIAYMSDPNTQASALYGLTAPMGVSLDAMKSLVNMVQGLRDTFVRVTDHAPTEGPCGCTVEKGRGAYCAEHHVVKR